MVALLEASPLEGRPALGLSQKNAGQQQIIVQHVDTVHVTILQGGNSILRDVRVRFPFSLVPNKPDQRSNRAHVYSQPHRQRQDLSTVRSMGKRTSKSPASAFRSLLRFGSARDDDWRDSSSAASSTRNSVVNASSQVSDGSEGEILLAFDEMVREHLAFAKSRKLALSERSLRDRYVAAVTNLYNKINFIRNGTDARHPTAYLFGLYDNIRIYFLGSQTHRHIKTNLCHRPFPLRDQEKARNCRIATLIN